VQPGYRDACLALRGSWDEAHTEASCEHHRRAERPCTTGTRDTIEELFAQTLVVPGTFDFSVTNFSPLPELMVEYAMEYIKTKGTTGCPGVDDNGVGKDATISLRTLVTNSEFNGYTLRSTQTKNHTLVLPLGLFGTETPAGTCGTLVLVDFRSAVWFPFRGGYFDSESLATAGAAIPDDHLEVMSDKVISVLLPVGSKSFTFADPLRFTIPATSDRVGQAPRDLAGL